MAQPVDYLSQIAPGRKEGFLNMVMSLAQDLQDELKQCQDADDVRDCLNRGLEALEEAKRQVQLDRFRRWLNEHPQPRPEDPWTFRTKPPKPKFVARFEGRHANTLRPWLAPGWGRTE